MDPIDLNSPGPGQQQPASLRNLLGALRRWPVESLRALRSLLLWILLAPAAWLLLALLLARLQLEQDNGSGVSATALGRELLDPAFQAPLFELASNTADMLFWPVVALFLLLFVKGVLAGHLAGGRISRVVQATARAGSEAQRRAKFRRTVEAAAQARARAKAMSMPEFGSAPAPAPIPQDVGQTDSSAPGPWRIVTPALSALRVIPFAVVCCAALWSLLAGVAAFGSKDHWEALPWVTPPYLTDFLARHPGLVVERVNDARHLITVRDGQGHSTGLEGSELAGAKVRLESCPRQLSAAQLGGIAPYPGMPCVSLVRLSNAYGEQMLYVFNAGGSANRAVYAHFERWAGTLGGSGLSSSSDRDGVQHYLSAAGRDGISADGRPGEWRLDVDSRHGRAMSVIIRHLARDKP
jgi:hypothetical protein